METLIDKIVIDDELKVFLEFIERRIHEGNVVYVLRFTIGDKPGKETVSSHKEIIEEYYNNCKDVML